MSGNGLKPIFTIPKEGLLDPAQLRQQEAIERAEAIAKAERERFEEIANEIVKILMSHNITTGELPRLIQTLTGKINSKIDSATIDKILKL